MRQQTTTRPKAMTCASGCYKVFDKQARRWVCVRCGN